MPLILTYSQSGSFPVRGLYGWAQSLPVAQPKSRLILHMGRAPNTMTNSAFGAGFVAGTVQTTDTTKRKRIYAVDQAGFTCHGDTFSDPVTGEFRIYPLARGRRYTILARDNNRNYNAVVADGVRPIALSEEQA